MAEDCGKMLPGTPGVGDGEGKLIRTEKKPKLSWIFSAIRENKEY